MQVVILAGGEGTRLKTLTKNTPKPMVEVNEKPFLEYLIISFKNSGFNRFLFLIGYKNEQIVGYFKNGSNWNVSISYSIETELLGTGGALKNASHLLEDEFMLVNGDTFISISYKNVLQRFRDLNKDVLMTVYNNRQKIFKFNTKASEEDMIENYNKKEQQDSNCVDAGLLVLKKKVLDLISDGKKCSLEDEIFLKLIQKQQLSTFKTDQRFYDMGTLEGLEQIKDIIL